MTQGKLYIVATPIGNLEDITLRAIRILKEVDLIACEDTRHTIKLLNYYGITTPRESYHKHNEASRSPRLLELIRGGNNIALVSDAGTPLLSDPGRTIVSLCRREGITVVTIPGPSAAIAALSGSGLSTENFFFAGFLPARASLRKRTLQKLASIAATLVFFESPHRLLNSLEDMAAILGPRRAGLARELTKVHEEWIMGTLAEIINQLKTQPKIRGEITLVVEGGEVVAVWSKWPVSLKQHLEEEMQRSGTTPNQALKSVAKQRGITRKKAYTQLLQEK